MHQHPLRRHITMDQAKNDDENKLASTRRSGRNRKSTPLSASLKEYVDKAPPDEVLDLKSQLETAIGSVANGNSSSGSTNATASDAKEDSSSPSAQRLRDDEAAAAHRRPSGEFYNPTSSSRRNSRAGEELRLSMKLDAQKVLAELGEISDDDSDVVELRRVGLLEGLREESMRELVKEDSKEKPDE